jgi:hypothetical protein
MDPRPLRRLHALLAGATVLVLMAPALRLDARVLAHPASTHYPGLDDVQYVTGTGGGTVWPGMADVIRRDARGRRVYILSPTAYTQVLLMLLGPDPRYVSVSGRAPEARLAQFAVSDEIPFLDASAAELMRKLNFKPVWRYPRPRGGATATLYERP